MSVKGKKIKVPNKAVDYIEGTPLSIRICNIRHSPIHMHSNDIELVFCLKGTVRILCNHELLLLREQEMFLINSDDLHCIYSNTDNVVICFHINLSNLSTPWDYLEYVYFSCEDKNYQQHQKLPMQRIKSIILSSAFTYARLHGIDEKTGYNIANAVVDILLEYFDWYNTINVYPNCNEEIRTRLQHIAKYCENNYTNKLTISELSRIVNINGNYLSQFLHKSPYGSFSNMIGYIRCYKAQYLLLTTNLSIIQISQQCGFSDDKYFYKSFRYWWKMTPKQFKNRACNYYEQEDRICSISDEDAFNLLEPFLAEYYARQTLNLND